MKNFGKIPKILVKYLNYQYKNKTGLSRACLS